MFPCNTILHNDFNFKSIFKMIIFVYSIFMKSSTKTIIEGLALSSLHLGIAIQNGLLLKACLLMTGLHIRDV